MTRSEWTRESKLLALMRLPWDIQVMTEEDGSLFAKVGEIPDAVADAENERELAQEIWESLYASLTLRLDHNDPITLPVGHRLPWEHGEPDWHPNHIASPALKVHQDAYERAMPTVDAGGKFSVAGL